MSVLNNVEVSWACVQQPNKKFISTGEWSVQINKLTKEQADCLQAEAKALHPKGIKIKNEDDGTKSFKFKRKCIRADGVTPNPKPVVLDMSGKEIKELIGNGSICNVQYSFSVYKHATFGEGVTSDLKAIQVIKLVPYGAKEDGSEFSFSSEGASSDFNDGDFE
ncbi:single-stranded DNA-binding protein [Caudoviricetes sp.]|nr:single-stranded DNA-binding protein [Caudoviricetes sp.]